MKQHPIGVFSETQTVKKKSMTRVLPIAAIPVAP
jgi:hypothetical protein